MSDGSVGGDYQVEIFHDRRGVHEGATGIIDMPRIKDGRTVAVSGNFAVAVFLKTYQTHAGEFGEQGEEFEWNVALAIFPFPRSAVPIDSDAIAAHSF